MAQTAIGRKRARATMIERHGSDEAYRAFMGGIGTQGGKNGRGHSFAHGRVSPSEAGKIGGVNRHRRPKL